MLAADIGAREFVRSFAYDLRKQFPVKEGKKQSSKGTISQARFQGTMTFTAIVPPLCLSMSAGDTVCPLNTESDFP